MIMVDNDSLESSDSPPLKLMDTSQFRNSYYSKYQGISELVVFSNAKRILQFQFYELFRISFIRFNLTHSFTEKEFFDYSLHSFIPDEHEVNLYIKNPKFMWRFSQLNYNCFKYYFKHKSPFNKLQHKITNLGFVTYDKDDSPLVDYVDFPNLRCITKLKSITTGSNNSYVGLSSKINDYQKKFLYHHSTCMASEELMYSDDMHLHMLDTRYYTYDELVSYLISGTYNNKKSQLLKIQIKQNNNKFIKGFKKLTAKVHKHEKSNINNCSNNLPTAAHELQINQVSNLIKEREVQFPLGITNSKKRKETVGKLSTSYISDKEFCPFNFSKIHNFTVNVELRKTNPISNNDIQLQNEFNTQLMAWNLFEFSDLPKLSEFTIPTNDSNLKISEDQSPLSPVSQDLQSSLLYCDSFKSEKSDALDKKASEKVKVKPFIPRLLPTLTLSSVVLYEESVCRLPTKSPTTGVLSVNPILFESNDVLVKEFESPKLLPSLTSPKSMVTSEPSSSLPPEVEELTQDIPSTKEKQVTDSQPPSSYLSSSSLTSSSLTTSPPLQSLSPPSSSPQPFLEGKQIPFTNLTLNNNNNEEYRTNETINKTSLFESNFNPKEFFIARKKNQNSKESGTQFSKTPLQKFQMPFVELKKAPSTNRRTIPTNNTPNRLGALRSAFEKTSLDSKCSKEANEEEIIYANVEVENLFQGIEKHFGMEHKRFIHKYQTDQTFKAKVLKRNHLLNKKFKTLSN